MKKAAILLVLLGFCLKLSAQEEKAREIIKVLSADSLAGRGYEENGQKKAASFISKFLQEQGVSNLEQTLQYPVNTFGSAIQFLAHKQQGISEFQAGKDFLIHPSSGSIQLKEKEVQEISVNETEFFNFHSKKVYSIKRNSENTDEINTLVNQFINSTHFKNSLLIIEDSSKLTWYPAQNQSKNAVIYLQKPLSAKSVTARWKAFYKENFSSSNIVAKIPGRKSDSIFMFSAHYDHLGKLGKNAIFKGANDNASGVAMLLTLAAYFAENLPAYDTYFLFTTGEELGLLGSKYFIENPLFNLRKVKMLINLDMVGTGDEGITVVNAKKQQQFFQFLSNNNNGSIAQIKSRGEACNSDHCFFDQIGVPSVFIYTLGGKQAYHDINDDGAGLSLTAFNALQALLIEYIESDN